MSEENDTSTEETAVEETAPADTFEVPEDLDGLSLGELTTLASQVGARGQELAAKAAELDDDGLEEAEALAEVDAELAAAIGSRQERAASALSRFATDTVEEADTETPEADAAVDGELAADTTEDDAADGENEDAVPDEAEPEALSARRRSQFNGASPAALKTKSKAPAPKPVAREDFMVATAFAKDPENTAYDSPADVANALWKRRMAFGNNIPSGVRQEQITIATGEKQFADETPIVLGMDPQENLMVLRGSREALVASGAQCTPQNQLYDFFRLAQPIRDIEDCLPTVQAPRGGIRYIQANCTLQGAGTIGVWGGLTEGSIDPETGEKPFDTVTCPDIAEVNVEAVTKGMVFDNLQYRTFPELIENFMEDVAVQFTRTKQRYYLDAIDAAATLTAGIGAYGAARALLYDWTVAANGYRKRHHMPRGSMVQLLAPDWSIDLIKADLFYDGDNGLDFMNVPDSAVTEALSARNIEVCWFYDDPTQVAASNGLAMAQAAGALNDYPTTVSSFMYAPGTWVKLDGGSLDVGLYRDHSLNKTNDFAMFMEEWLGIAQMGCETIRIDSDVCADGSRAPYADALRTCTGYGS